MNNLQQDISKKNTVNSIQKNKKILIIDDEIDDLEAMDEILTIAGHSIIKCNDSTDALEMISKQNIDLILMDLMLPTLSGTDLLKILREKIGQQIPIILVSIKPKKEVDMADIDGFVQKPFSPSSLIDEVNIALTKYDKKDW